MDYHRRNKCKRCKWDIACGNHCRPRRRRTYRKNQRSAVRHQLHRAIRYELRTEITVHDSSTLYDKNLLKKWW